MEKKEELLERLVNGIELQNKLLAMQLADSIGIPNFMLLDNEQKISALNENADIILKAKNVILRDFLIFFANHQNFLQQLRSFLSQILSRICYPYILSLEEYILFVPCLWV